MSNIAHFSASDLTDSQVRDLLSGALRQKTDRYCYVQSVNSRAGTLTFSYWGDGDDKMYEATFAIGDDYTVTLTDAVPVIQIVTNEKIDGDALFSIESDADTGAIRAQFSVNAEFDRTTLTIGDEEFAVYGNTLLFRAGDYPDKQFSMSPEEIGKAAASWKPIGGNIQHTQFLKGKAAFIDTVWTEDDNKTLRGKVRIPLALDNLLTADEKKVSLEWTRADKLADGFALCTNPRISDAVLMSLDTHPQPVPAQTAVPEKEKPSMKSNPLQAIYDLLKAHFTGKPEGEGTGDATVTSTQDAKNAETDAALRQAVADAEAAAITARAAQFTAEAQSFVLAEITAGRALPAERDLLQAQYVRAAQDDSVLKDTVSFTNDGATVTGSRVDQLKAAQLSRPSHQLFVEHVGSDQKVLFSEEPAKPGERIPDMQDIYERRAQAQNSK